MRIGIASRPASAFVRCVIAAVVVASMCVAAAHAGGRDVHGIVVGVSDGDTLTVLSGRERIRVRLAGIDAPERGQPYAGRARQSLAELCFDRPATLSVAGKDRYGRVVATVSCNGVTANGEQVRRGLAWVYTRYARRDSPLHGLEAEARSQRRGLWQTGDPMPPWEWRSRRRAGGRADA